MAKRLANHYEGNPRVKAAGVNIDFTEKQIQEFLKCSQDCAYFIETYMKIIHVDRGVIPFKLYTYQKRIIDAVTNNRYSMAKLPRQAGKTQCLAGIILWYFLFNEHQTFAILANKEDQAKEILDRIKLSYEFLPFWLQQGIVEWNQKGIEAENGSYIFAAATSSSAIRGRSLNFVLLDEFAHVDANIQVEFFTSVFPTISSGTTTKAVITSTPNGLDLFYKIWTDSEQGKNAFVRVDAEWNEMPGRDEKWRLEQLKIMNEDKFDQEYRAEFLGSSATLISGRKLKTLASNSPIVCTEHLRVYCQPEKDHYYVICVDVAEGTNRDNSAFIVVDVSSLPYQIVATFTDNTISAYLYPNVIHPIAQRYNNAALLIEANGPGQQVIDILHNEFEYDNMIMTVSNGRKGVQVSYGFADKQGRLGIKQTMITKRIGCTSLKTLVENDKLVFYDQPLITELSKFTLQGKSYKAEPGEGNTDDLVMGCVLFGWLQTTDYITENADVNMRKTLIQQNQAALDAEILPVGFVEHHQPDEDTVYDLDAWLRDD